MLQITVKLLRAHIGPAAAGLSASRHRLAPMHHPTVIIVQASYPPGGKLPHPPPWQHSATAPAATPSTWAAAAGVPAASNITPAAQATPPTHTRWDGERAYALDAHALDSGTFPVQSTTDRGALCTDGRPLLRHTPLKGLRRGSPITERIAGAQLGLAYRNGEPCGRKHAPHWSGAAARDSTAD